jgi:hypothetical protein
VSKSISRVLYLVIIYLGLLSPTGSSDLPTGKRRAAAFQELCLTAISSLTWSCSGWGLHGQHVTILPVSSYLTISTLPRLKAGGRYVSVALSLKSPSPDVIWHPYPMEPGLSSYTGSPRYMRLPDLLTELVYHRIKWINNNI